MKVLLTSLFLILLIAYAACCIGGLNGLGHLNNAFVENFDINDKEKCDSGVENLRVLEAPNVPVDPRQNYLTGYNANSCDKFTQHMADTSGKFCFPVVRFKYDGIWSDVDNNSKDFQKKDWILPKHKTKFVDSQYCADKLLMLPELKMNPGDVIVQPTDSCIINKDNPIYCNLPTCQDYTGVYKI